MRRAVTQRPRSLLLLDADQLVTGFTRPDGTQERLSEDDLKRCMSGARNLALAASGAVIKAFALYDMHGCLSRSRCRQRIQYLLLDHAETPEYFPMYKPFDDWSAYFKKFWERWRGICGDCSEKLNDRFALSNEVCGRGYPASSTSLWKGGPKRKTPTSSTTTRLTAIAN
ncbi:hypothetical protein L226DRAFT_350629 [Lentinus tigrinus ALCF2SS1-7]|uniref:uncharacterized protein n=1 Tax=Lentinus tigrinus ALCF2SS1-7 TaxID=1328758 RepID=UPI0011660CE3|nr:hypothetical protein L226DRAFT_350629 [Lentinus tigrinus ALCF2SS1-7]